MMTKAPATNSFQPSDGGIMAITPYVRLRKRNDAGHFAIFVLLLTLLMAECITRPIIVKLAMKSITTGPLINPDQIHWSDFYAR